VASMISGPMPSPEISVAEIGFDIEECSIVEGSD
jgi:hypothetical protein